MKENKSGTSAILRDLSTQIGKSILMALPPVRRWRLRSPRTSNNLNEPDIYLRDSAFLGLNLLLAHAGADGVKAKSICEIGPGDFLSSGLSMLAAGAWQYTAIDRFPGNYYGKEAKRLYEEIAAEWSKYYPTIDWDKSIDVKSFPEGYESRIKLIAEPIEKVTLTTGFDIVCSFQVAEHVSDIDVFAEAHNRLLKKDGIGVHRVDLGPHDVWSEYRDPTTFLRFPSSVWGLTGSNRGIPNRRRHHEFLEAFDKANLDVEILLTEHFDEEFIDYSKLDKQFLSMPKDSVLTKTAIYRLKRRQ